MNKTLSVFTRFLIPLFVILSPFVAISYLTENVMARLLAIAIAIIACYAYSNGLHRVTFNIDSKTQKAVFAAAMLVLILFSFFICAVSIEKEWMHEYPLKGKVDNYGCYPQMFDAFQKGQLHIDSETDISVLETLENPYDTAARREATGVKFGPTWDRAYYNGKLYSYFGIAPVVFLYFPVYFLTGKVLSDALAAAIMTAVGCCVMMLLLRELCARMKNKPPFLLFLLGAVTLPFGALLWSTETCANFYHLAVLSGICAICTFFLHVLKAEKARDGFKKKMHYAFAGICIAATVASRPNLVLYMIIALPLLFSVIAKRKYGTKSLILDITAFCVPMFILGGLIMLYNNARFGSPFDFGANYQLTLADTSTYSLSSMLALPAFYHFFLQAPKIDSVFPYLHPAVSRLSDYGVERVVYTSSSVGSIFFPCTWGTAVIPMLWKRDKRTFLTALLAFLCVAFIAVFDLCYGGVHLRYAADIMFVLALLGVYMLLYAVSNAKDGSGFKAILYTCTALFFLITILVELPLIFDNERDMILKYHTEFYNFIKG